MSKSKLDEQRVQFGKYKGRLVSWVVDNDYYYAIWLAKKSNSMTKTRLAAKRLIDENKLKNKL